MKKKIMFSIGFITLFYILFSVSYGKELVYSLDMIIFKNDSVDLKNITVIYGYPGEFSGKETGYTIKIFGENSELFDSDLHVSFLLSLDPIGTVHSNSTFIHINVPYFENAKNIILYHSEKKIMDINLHEKFCNKNDICETGENENNCPEDCLEVEDGVEEEGFPWLFLVIGGVILILIVLVFIVTKRPSQKDNFKQLKQKWG